MGVAVGPDKADKSWSKANTKLVERAWTWHETKCGLHLAARAYNVFGASTMTYISQLEDVPPSALAAERKALSLAA